VDSFIVGFWASMFRILSWPSLFTLARWLAPERTRTYVFVDCWALGNLVLAGFSLVCGRQGGVSTAEWVLILYGGLRVFEVIVYQINVLLFDEYRALRGGQTYAVRGYRRLVVLSLQNYVELLLWFAFAYRNAAAWFSSAKIPVDTASGALYFAVVTMATVGYGDITPINRRGAAIVVAQSAVGLFMTLMILARFVGILKPPATLDPFEAETPPNPPLQPTAEKRGG
jgi:hypothetical protein